MGWKKVAFVFAVVGVGAQAELKPVDYIAPQLCGQPSRAERICLLKAPRTHRHYLSIERGKTVHTIPLDLQPTGAGRVVFIEGETTHIYSGIGATLDADGYLVEAAFTLETFKDTGPNNGLPVRAKLLTNGKVKGVGHSSFDLEPVITTQSKP